MSFNPNDVGMPNGNIFGFPVTEAMADIVIIPIPWDVTASYGKGTSKGPKAILDASVQLDFFHPRLEQAYATQVYMTPVSDAWQDINDHLNEQLKSYFQDLEILGSAAAIEKHHSLIDEVNRTHQALTQNLEERATKRIEENKICAVLGGEHSTPLGLIKALLKKFPSMSILQIDAHADLRKAYEGFEQSHASIMYNAVDNFNAKHTLTQVGIRDLSEEEYLFAQAQKNIHTFFDWQIKEDEFLGKTWNQQCDEIIKTLSETVYISFDIDGLNSTLCPNTGTPVPGGFTLEQISHLIFKITDAGKRIVGFDLNEVAPGTEGDWDANVGARALWQLVCATEKSRKTL